MASSQQGTAPIIPKALSFLALWPYPNPLCWLLLIPTDCRRTWQTEREGVGGGVWLEEAGTERQTGSSNVALKDILISPSRVGT